MPYAFSRALTLHNQCWPCTGCKALTTYDFRLPSSTIESGPRTGADTGLPAMRRREQINELSLLCCKSISYMETDLTGAAHDLRPYLQHPCRLPGGNCCASAAVHGRHVTRCEQDDRHTAGAGLQARRTLSQQHAAVSRRRVLHAVAQGEGPKCERQAHSAAVAAER